MGNSSGVLRLNRANAQASSDDWMKKTGGGSRKSSYSTPKREPIRKEKGNVAEVIRDKNRRTKDQSY